MLISANYLNQLGICATIRSVKIRNISNVHQPNLGEMAKILRWHRSHLGSIPSIHAFKNQSKIAINTIKVKLEFFVIIEIQFFSLFLILLFQVGDCYSFSPIRTCISFHYK